MARLKGSHALEQYRNLMENHLLHISLVHEINPFISIEHMYPHEMPFKHNGLYPGWPTIGVLEKVDEFLNVVDSTRDTKTYKEKRKKLAAGFLNELSQKPIVETQGVLTILLKKLSRIENESLSDYLKRWTELLEDKDALETVLKSHDDYYTQKEIALLEKISDEPKASFDNYSSRLKKEGMNSDFSEEFGPLVKKIYMQLISLESVEAAIAIEPKLSLMRESAVKRIEDLIAQNHMGYREALDEIFRVSEFFDIVERTLKPDEANPLHYAKRYEYYIYSVFSYAPDHITIPSTLSLQTFDLLAISGVPIGFAGFSASSLWVDSYLQTPNEFILHDAGNHERRRYQFTRNYMRRLEISEQDTEAFVTELDGYLQEAIIPMIKRINIKASNAIDFSDKESFLSKFIELTPGIEFFTDEIESLKREIDQTTDLTALNKKYRAKINRKKTLYDMILFEVVHEDALPPSRLLIIESILRPPNTPMPRDFIDFEKRAAVHAMEPAGTTMAYILHKLNGSFYDTPKKRLLAVSAPEYRTPKQIIIGAAEIVKHLGGLEGLSLDEAILRVAYLTITEEGFLSYLVEEFQRDLHPIQKSLLRSLKFAEAIEVLNLIGEFEIDAEFKYFINQVRERIKLASDLIKTSSDSEVQKVLESFAKLEDENFLPFDKLQEKYFKLGADVTERVYAKIHKIEIEEFKGQFNSSEEVEIALAERRTRRKFLNSEWNSNGTTEILNKVEALTFEIEALEKILLRKKQSEKIDKYIRENSSTWSSISPNNISREKLVVLQASIFHDKHWLENFRSVYGVKGKFRDVPKHALLENETGQEAYDRFLNAGYTGIRLNENGILQQNINLESFKLIPALHAELNLDLAGAYVDVVLEVHRSGEALSKELVESLADRIHFVWMNNNKEKIRTAFSKINLEVLDMEVDEIIARVASLSFDEWSLMTVNEINALKQFVPTEKLPSQNLQKDINVGLLLIEQITTQGQLDQAFSYNDEFWTSLSIDQINSDEISQRLAQVMHDDFCISEYRNSFLNKTNYKKIPTSTFLIGEDPSDAKRRLEEQGYNDLVFEEGGHLYQNINNSYKEIVPELRELLAGSIANKYVALVLEAKAENKSLSVDLLNELSDQVHDVWMSENIWQLESAFNKLGIDINNLEISDVFKVIRSMDKASWLKMNEKERAKLKQFVPTDKLNFREQQNNHRIVLAIIELLQESQLSPHKGLRCNSVL